MLATTVAGNEMSKESHIVGGSLVGLDNKPVTTEAAKNHVELVDMIDMLSEQHPDIEKIQFITALNPGEATEITMDVASVTLSKNEKTRVNTMRMTSSTSRVLEIQENATHFPSEKTATYYDASWECTRAEPCNVYESEEDVPNSKGFDLGNQTGVNGRRLLGRRRSLFKKQSLHGRELEELESGKWNDWSYQAVAAGATVSATKKMWCWVEVKFDLARFDTAGACDKAVAAAVANAIQKYNVIYPCSGCCHAATCTTTASSIPTATSETEFCEEPYMKVTKKHPFQAKYAAQIRVISNARNRELNRWGNLNTAKRDLNKARAEVKGYEDLCERIDQTWYGVPCRREKYVAKEYDENVERLVAKVAAIEAANAAEVANLNDGLKSCCNSHATDKYCP